MQTSTPTPTPTFEVYVNGIKIQGDAPPVVENNEIFLPVRTVAESLNINAQWDAQNKQITFKSNDNILTMTLDKTEYVFNNKKLAMSSSIKLYSGRTFVPARYIIEAFGGTINLDYTNNSINIQNPHATPST